MTLFSKKVSNLNDYTFKIFIGFCIIIHSLITVFALYTDILPLVAFNILSILIYIICINLIKKRPILVFYISFSEIILHSFITVILIGNDFGFSMYFIAIIPLSFHLLNAVKSKKYLLKAFIFSSISFFLFATCYIISITHEHFYISCLLDILRPYVYLVNMLITFGTLLLSTIMFYIEINSAYKSLYDKNQELDNLANTDHLTGLYNRRTMTVHVQNMYEDYHTTQKPFSLIVCDIDNFKKINDTYGHERGDEVLIKISSILSTQTRGLDFVCRWGGEEFIVFLRDIDKSTALTIAERIRQEIEKTEILFEDIAINVTMTLGVSCVTETNDYKQLFDLADSRMYEGKKSGKNKVV